MGKRAEFEWNPDIVKGLVDKSGLTLQRLAESTGVAPESLRQYLSGRTNPEIGALIKLADFFAVQVDYLIGRSSEELCERIDKEYGKVFMELRKAPYEAYLNGRHRTPQQMLGRLVETPWPYNILDDVVSRGEPGRWEEVLSNDQMDGLEYVLSGFSERTQRILNQYYRAGMTLEEVAKVNEITRERVRQIIAKAIHKMRHPSRLRYIEIGISGVAKEAEYARRIQDLKEEYERKEQELREKIGELDEKERKIEERAGDADEVIKSWKNVMSAPPGWFPPETPLEDMYLSTRSYNCLKRAGAKTLDDVCEITQAGRLIKLRNVGKKSLEEILERVKTMTGKGFEFLYRRWL